MSDKLMFPYDQTTYNENLEGLKLLQSDDGVTLATRFWQSKNESSLILYFHGNYLDIGLLSDMAEKFNNHGFSVMALDYRGYGLSGGKATEQNVYKDAQLLFDNALSLGYKENQIIIVGRSIGTGAATELAVNNKSQALVLISPFVSVYRVITKLSLLPFDKFKNLSKISKISEPLFIIHGDEDTVIPAWHSELIYNKYAGKKYRFLIKGAGHNDVFNTDMDDLINQFKYFINN
ncbi:MAG: alpha/beta hydrolase [Marinicellaceae bacterium]